jgi:hypothetical protein
MRPINLEDKADLAFALWHRAFKAGDLERARYYARSYETYQWMIEQEAQRGIDIHRQVMRGTEELRRKLARNKRRRRKGSRLNPDDPYAAGGPTGSRSERRLPSYLQPVEVPDGE